ncbi:MAG: HupE/UreJ family protein [Aquirufa sp.]
MSHFQTYLLLGFQHIMNWQALDHIVFILAISCIFGWKDIKQLLWLVTAFTVGHSITLALATLGSISIDVAWIEFLIPCTILIRAVQNLRFKEMKKRKTSAMPYFTVIFFGLIHGLGFSNYLQSLLGKELSITVPLFAFNIGLELGQLIIVSLVLLLTSTILYLTNVKRKHYVWVVSGIVIGLVLPMLIERIP